MSNRSSHFLEGSPGHHFATKKVTAEDGSIRYEVTCPSHPEFKWADTSEVDAIRLATRDMQDKVMKGEV